MKKAVFGTILWALSAQASVAQQPPLPPTDTIRTALTHSAAEQEVIDLSRRKWDWMADRNVRALAPLFDDRAMFAHMGGTWGKALELATIGNGGIWYKKAFIDAVDVRILGDTAIVLEDIDLQAVVGGRELVNPFIVTEVYTKHGGTWRLAQLTFSRLVRPVRTRLPD